MSGFKTLGQAQPPTPGTAVKLYTGSTNSATGRVTVNNRPGSNGVTPAAIGIEVRIAGAATTPSDYKYEVDVTPGIPYTTPAFGVGPTDEVWVTSGLTNVNFNMDGFEL